MRNNRELSHLYSIKLLITNYYLEKHINKYKKNYKIYLKIIEKIFNLPINVVNH
jgi:hypothetical protein